MRVDIVPIFRPLCAGQVRLVWTLAGHLPWGSRVSNGRSPTARAITELSAVDDIESAEAGAEAATRTSADQRVATAEAPLAEEIQSCRDDAGCDAACAENQRLAEQLTPATNAGGDPGTSRRSVTAAPHGKPCEEDNSHADTRWRTRSPHG